MSCISTLAIVFLTIDICSAGSLRKWSSQHDTTPVQQSPDLGEIANIVGETLLKDNALADSPLLQMLPGVVNMLPQLLNSDLGQKILSTALQTQMTGVVGPLLSQVLSPEVANSKFVSELTEMSGDRFGSAVNMLEQVAGPSFHNIMSLANQVGSSLLSSTHGVVTGSVAVGLGLTVISYIIQYVGVLFGTEINLIDAIRGEMGSIDAPSFGINIRNALDKYD